MLRYEQIRQASQIGIGYILGCEDAARDRVKRLFRKNNDINYKKLDNDYILNSDDQYKKDQDRYNTLLNKMFNLVLTDLECLEFNYLNDKIGAYTETYFIQKIIQLSVITFVGMNKKIKKHKIKALKHFKKYFEVFIVNSLKRPYFGIIGKLSATIHYSKSIKIYIVMYAKYWHSSISPPKILLE